MAPLFRFHAVGSEMDLEHPLGADGEHLVGPTSFKDTEPPSGLYSLPIGALGGSHHFANAVKRQLNVPEKVPPLVPPQKYDIL